MSISHIALIVNMVHMIIWCQNLGYVVHDMVYDWFMIRFTIRNLFRSGLFRRSKEREKTKGPQKTQHRKQERTNAAPHPRKKKEKNPTPKREEEEKQRNSKRKKKKEKKRREKKRKKEVKQLNSKKKKGMKKRKRICSFTSVIV